MSLPCTVKNIGQFFLLMQALAKFYPKLVDVEFCYNITLLAIIAKYDVLNRE